MITMRKNISNRGFKLIELLSAITIFLIVLSMAYMGLVTLSRTAYNEDSDVGIREGARVGLNNISQNLRMGQYIFVNRTVTIQSITYTIPPEGGSGNSLVFASPESGSAGSITYTIRGYYLRQRTPSDPTNPNALQLMMYLKTTVSPPIVDTPSSINLASLSGGTSRMLADYVAPGGTLFKLGDPSETVYLNLVVQKNVLTKRPAVETFYNQVMLRNF